MVERARKARRTRKRTTPRPGRPKRVPPGYGGLAFDGRGRLVGASRNAGVLLGVSAGALRPGTPYRTLRAALAPAQRQALPASLGDEVRVLRAAGLASLAIPIRGQGVQLVLSTEPDAWAAAELATREGVRQAVLESSRDAVAMFDPEDRLVAFNRNMVTLMGPNVDLFEIGTRLEDIVRALEARGAYQSRARGVDEYLARHAAQRTGPLDFVYSYADGRVIEAIDRRTEQGFTVLVRADITERVERERELAEQNTLLELALANMSNGITYYDADRRLRLWNARYAELFGLAPGALREGMAFDEVLRLIVGEEPDQSAAETPMTQHEESTFRRTTRAGRLIEVRHKPVERGGGVGTFTDITELEDARRKLEAALVEAHRADALKSIFLANVTHELRTPLNAITGYSELLAGGHYGTLNDKQREFVDSIAVGGRHLLALIDGIIEITRIEAHQIKLDLGPVDLAHLVGHAIRTVEAARHGRPTARISAALDPHLPDVVADDGKLRQILINLIGNAAKFTPPGGEVTVRARLEPADGAGPASCVVEVADTGPGIAAEDLARVFEPFYRAETAATRAIEGSGLGLAVAKSLAELHGGRLEIESRVGQGTLARLTFPAQPNATSTRA